MTEYTPFAVVEEGIDHNTLKDNRKWVEASVRLYSANHGTLPDMDKLESYDGDNLREKIAEYGLKQMAGFNFNIVDQALDTRTILDADQKAKEAFVYMLDQYDEVNTSWKTTGDAAWEMVTDATNWLGLITAGTGAVASQAAKAAGKQIIKKKIKDEIKRSLGKTAVLVGLEGAAHGAAFDVMDQAVRVDAGSQDEFSAGQTALSAGIGFAAGATLGVGVDVVATKLGNRKAQKSLEKQTKADKEKAEKMAAEDVNEAKIDKKAREEVGDTVDPDTAAKPLTKEEIEVEVKKVEEDIKANPRQDELSGKSIGSLVLRDSRDLINVKADHIVQEVFTNPDFVHDVIMKLEGLQLSRKAWLQLDFEFNAAMAFLDKAAIGFMKVVRDPKSSNAAKKRAQAELDKLEPLQARAFSGMTHLNSYNGRALNIAKIGKVLERDEYGNIKPEAYNMAFENEQLAKIKSIESEYYPEINRLLNSKKEGDFSKGLALIKKRDEEVNIIRGTLTAESVEGLGKINKAAEQWVEASISGVFSPSTVLINTVFPMLKNYTYPLLDQIINNPLSLTQWRKMVRVYGQMFAAHSAATKSFRAAWEFEQTLLTKDPSRFLEGGIKISGEGAKSVAGKFIKGNLASYMRTFPRLLGATDAYNQELAAAGIVAGDAFDRLLTKGMKKGLKGNKLKKYIDDNMADEVNKAYDEKLTIDALTPVYEKGKALGLEGDKLEKYVLDNVNKLGTKTFRRLGNDRKVKELLSDAEKLRNEGKKVKGKERNKLYAEARALEKEAKELEEIGANARDYVETLLYKKEFQTDKVGIAGAMERGAKRIEQFHKDHPLAKIFGQLFFRTPAWVFHESMRLTPAINVMLPQFRNDLAGLNGVGRQARAQTEATLAFSLMMYVTTKWAQGEITGSANRDYTMIGEQETDELGALSIQIGDEGKHFDYRRYEPLRIPMTIVVNTLDGIMATRERENMGEKDDGLYDRTLAGMGIAMATFISAFQDSALFTGIVDTVTAGSRSVGAFTSDDPDAREDAWNVGRDLLMKKALMVVPSTAKKAQVAMGDNELTAPVDYQQRFLASFSPNHPSLPRKTDIFGNVRVLDNPMTVLNPFWYSTPEQRRAGRSEKEMVVHRWIDELEQKGFGNFTRSKFKSSKFPVDDLREAKIIYNGMETDLYSAMSMELNKPHIKQPLIAELYSYATRDVQHLGNPEERKQHSWRVTKTKAAIQKAKNDALDAVIGNSKNRLIKTNEPLSKVVRDQDIINQKAQDGIFIKQDK